jgi:hypothetical protein
LKIFERIVVVAGLITLAVLFWKFDPAVVWSHVSMVGWGFLIVLPLQFLDHAFNVWGWRFAFAPEHARVMSFGRLLWVRVAGDGVNYLTPSGTIAGEIVRPAMLGPTLPAEVRNSSVVVAKFSQSLGQALFALIGMLVLLPVRLGFLPGRQIYAGLGGALFILLGVVAAIVLLVSRRGDGSYFWRWRGDRGRIRGQMSRYLRVYPGRFGMSTFLFMIGFATGAVEVFVICWFLGLRVDWVTALSIEVLSVVIDSVMFMVPAKVGTQEAGKTAIFAGLGMPAAQGLAFGVVRHMRELIWAGAGFLIYAWDRRRRARAARLEALCPLPGSPAVPAD